MSYEFDHDLSLADNWARMVRTFDEETALTLALMTPFISMLDDALDDMNGAALTISAYNHALEVLMEHVGEARSLELLEDHGVPLDVLGFDDDVIDMD